MVPSRTVENIANRILLSLPESSLKRLRHAFEFRTIAKNERIDRLDQPIEYMHFVNRGLISFVKTMLDGRSVEIGVVGIEGISNHTLSSASTRQFSKPWCKFQERRFVLGAIN